MKAVVLAPHTDDEVLGCGGTIVKLIESGYQVHVFAFSDGTSNVDEFVNSVAILGAKSTFIPHINTREFHLQRQVILDLLICMRDELHPEIVFLPSGSDIHQDHQVIYEEGVRAFKHSTIYGYELPWNSFNFPNGCYSKLDPCHVHKKVQALGKYESQANRIYFKEENVVSLARVRGMQAGSDYAECFEVIRQFI